mgnify:CR=1 FL=1
MNWENAKIICRTAMYTVAWAVCRRALKAIVALENGENRTGHNDGYNWDTNYDPTENTIYGSCSYGSMCIIEQNRVFLQTCGGHWIEGTMKDGNIVWSTDRDKSTQSWGEHSQWNVENMEPLAELEGEELEERRINSLKHMAACV